MACKLFARPRSLQKTKKAPRR